jgi:carbamoyltransferase
MQNKHKIILGISAFNHDASACIISNNKLVAFSEEERYNGQKNTGSVPYGAIKYCLKKANIKITEVNDIAFYFNLNQCYLAYIRNNNPLAWIATPRNLTSGRFFYEFSWLIGFHAKIKRLAKSIGANNAKMHLIPHHKSHSWYGLFSSQKKEGVVLSNDSIGELVSSYAIKWELENDKSITIQTLLSQNDPHSIGYLYGAITEFLGFSRKNGAGKIMALASFGTDKYASYTNENIKLLKNGHFKIGNGLIQSRSYKSKAQRLSNSFIKKFNLPEGKLTQEHYDIAFALQNTTEKIILHQVKYVSNFSENIVLTGGVAQNSVANGIVFNKFTDYSIFVPPIPHDSGSSIGAAIYLFHKLNKRLPEYTETAFLGESFSDIEIEDYLRSRKITYATYDTQALLVNDLISELNQGKAIGVFRNSMECGPRALGNRSILALPTIKGITKHLNKNVKYREPFRPYGVIVHEKNVDKYFKVDNNKCRNLQYMSYVFSFKDEYKSALKPVMHVDETCRVQSISNDSFYDLIFSALNKIKQPEIIINTSLNVRGKPICRSLSDAVSCFISSGMDYMVFNDKYVIKK